MTGGLVLDILSASIGRINGEGALEIEETAETTSAPVGMGATVSGGRCTPIESSS